MGFFDTLRRVLAGERRRPTTSSSRPTAASRDRDRRPPSRRPDRAPPAPASTTGRSGEEAQARSSTSCPARSAEWADLMAEARALGFDPDMGRQRQVEEFQLLVRRVVADRHRHRGRAPQARPRPRPDRHPRGRGRGRSRTRSSPRPKRSSASRSRGPEPAGRSSGSARSAISGSACGLPFAVDAGQGRVAFGQQHAVAEHLVLVDDLDVRDPLDGRPQRQQVVVIGGPLELAAHLDDHEQEWPESSMSR